MKLIKGTVKSCETYQYDGVTFTAYERLRRSGAFLNVAELDCDADSGLAADERVFLLNRNMLGRPLKTGQIIRLSCHDEPRDYQFLDLFRGEPYLLLTKSDALHHITLNAKNQIDSGARIKLHKAWQTKNIVYDLIWFGLVIAAAIYIFAII